jgi:diguanylate cyclase (GGDEF)-like protein/PAS domain S-box-containing protein
MTRDPLLQPRSAGAVGDAALSATLAALAVGATAALGLLAMLPWLGQFRLFAYRPLDDLLLSVPLATLAAAVFWRAWPALLRANAAAGWHRLNGMLVVPATTLAAGFFSLELGRLPGASGLDALLSALLVGGTAGGSTRWVLAVARAEARTADRAIGSRESARIVLIGVGGFVALVFALSATRNLEYVQRLSVLEPQTQLLEKAGFQRTLSVQLAREAQAGSIDGRALANTADQLLAEGIELDRLMGPAIAVFQHGSVDIMPAVRAQKAARDDLQAAVHEAQWSDPKERAAPLALVAARADAMLDASQQLVQRLRDAIDLARADLQRSTLAGFILLVLAAISAAGGLARGLARVAGAQQRAIELAAADQVRLASVLRSTANIVVMTDPHGRINWVNPAFERLTGYSLHDVAGRTPGSVLQCEDTDPATVARLRAAISARNPVRVEILNRDRSGKQYWIDLLIEPQFADDGRHTGFMAIERDITETVVMRERHRAFFAAMPAGVVVQDQNGVVVECNMAACAMLGLDAEQLRGRRSVDPRWGAIHEDGRPFPGEDHYAMRTLRTGEPLHDQVMGIRTPDGDLRWLSVSTRLIPGSSIGSREVVATFVDVTERRETARLVAAERARLAAALEATRAGVWYWRLDEGLVDTDLGWARIFNEAPAPSPGRRIGDWMRRLHPDDVGVAKAAAELHLGGLTDIYDTELRVSRVDGSWMWVHCRGQVTERAADGRPRSMLGTLVDISARKSAAQAAESEQHKLRTLFELAPVGVALARADNGVLIECNGTLSRMLGRHSNALVGRNLRDFTPPSELPDWEAHNAAFEQVGSVGPYEKHYERADGSLLPVLVSARRVPLADGSAAVWVIVQDMTDRKAMEEGLQREARTDKLTGLANRAALVERLEAVVAEAQADARDGFGLLFLDFDRFKLINDTLGHEAGDELLRQIAERLRRGLRSSDGDAASGTFVARIGGDEFVVVVDGTSDVVEIERVARRLLETLAAPYSIGGSEVQSSASIGMVSSAQSGLDAGAILRDADTAMYEAKRRGRGIAVLFDEGMRSRLQRQVEVERNLRRAIPNRELSVVFQPIVDLETGRMSSAEALLRWNSAELGEVPPSEFIPIAEDSGQVVDIGAWVLGESCRAFAHWCSEHPGSTTATVSVNLSRVQLGQPEQLLAAVEHALEASGLPAGRLQLEVTERDVMRDPASVLLLMRHLRAIGVRLAMDDFGTGTSSLACLRDYPFDVIKLDRAFVGDLGNNSQVLALVHATMLLIENLGMTSVAEGVETPAQAAILQSVGCRFGQGWLFGRPVPLDQLDPMPPLAAAQPPAIGGGTPA